MSTIAKFFVDKHWKSKLKLFLGFFLQTPATELTVVLFLLPFSLSLSLSFSLFVRLPLVAQVVLPTSMLFGFMYTMKHGEGEFGRSLSLVSLSLPLLLFLSFPPN